MTSLLVGPSSGAGDSPVVGWAPSAVRPLSVAQPARTSSANKATNETKRFRNNFMVFPNVIEPQDPSNQNFCLSSTAGRSPEPERLLLLSPFLPSPLLESSSCFE